MLQVFKNLSLPLTESEGKVVSTVTRATVLGIEIDSVEMVRCLLADKLAALCSVLAAWLTRTEATKHALLSLIGYLAFAAKVVPPGRTYIHRLLVVVHSVTAFEAIVRLDVNTRAALPPVGQVRRSCMTSHGFGRLTCSLLIRPALVTAPTSGRLVVRNLVYPPSVRRVQDN